LSLFVRGKYQPQVWEKAIAIVGTRNPSQAGTYLATKLSKNFSEAGWWIVSGLALGIDAAAHHGALERGRTIAVLGGGVLNIYPPEHHNLGQEIMEKGALLSENAPTATATAPRLVVRNRLISGFAKHLIVVETAIDGGAMHAARAALEQGRQVHTFDLPISGNQHLLQEGARLMDIACFPF
jgi:DNA processing protein